MIAEAMLPPPVEGFGKKKRDVHVSFWGSVYSDGLYGGHGAGGGIVWEEHQVCYVPIKAIFCECNNSIVEAIVFSFP